MGTTHSLTGTERDREHMIRRYVCPSCGAEPKKRCLGEEVTVERRSGQDEEEEIGEETEETTTTTTTYRRELMVSHTSRYELGVADGIVPPLVGAR